MSFKLDGSDAPGSSGVYYKMGIAMVERDPSGANYVIRQFRSASGKLVRIIPLYLVAVGTSKAGSKYINMQQFGIFLDDNGAPFASSKATLYDILMAASGGEQKEFEFASLLECIQHIDGLPCIVKTLSKEKLDELRAANPDKRPEQVSPVKPNDMRAISNEVMNTIISEITSYRASPEQTFRWAYGEVMRIISARSNNGDVVSFLGAAKGGLSVAVQSIGGPAGVAAPMARAVWNAMPQPPQAPQPPQPPAWGAPAPQPQTPAAPAWGVPQPQQPVGNPPWPAAQPATWPPVQSGDKPPF